MKPSGTRLEPAGIYGRDDEIAIVRSIVDSTSSLPTMAEIRGVAGAGKTTIWLAGIDAAASAGYVVLQCRPAETEANLSFAGLRDLIDGRFDDVADDLPEPQREALAVALLRVPRRDRPQRSGTVEAGFLRFLRLLASKQPVLVAIDDLQWLDRPTRRVIEFAARRLGSAPVAVLATQRTQVAPDPAMTHNFVHSIGPARVAIDLGPLSLGAVHALLRERLGITFPRPPLRRIHEASAGNPFVALEIARLVRDRGATLRTAAEIPLPDDVRRLIEHRLRPLPPGARRALVIAAALSDPTSRLVREAGGGDLRPAEAAGIVSLEGERVRFVHPLFASSVYRGASPEARRSIHRRLASLAPSIEERARHLALATREAEESVAGELERAAADAYERGAIDSAVELIGRACDLTPPAEAAGLHRRSIVLAEYCLKAGDTGRGREMAEAALAVAPAGTARAEALFYRGRAEMFGVDWRLAEDYFAQAAAEPGAAAAIRARIELAFAQLRIASWRAPGDGLDHARRAETLAIAGGRDDILCEALALKAKFHVLLGMGDPEPLLRRAEALEPAMAGLWVAQRPLDYVAAIREWQDDVAAARSAWAEILRLSDEHGDEASREWTLWRLAHAECLAGAWPPAIRHLEEGRALATQAGRRDNEAIYFGMLALVEAHIGNVGAARAHAERAGARTETADIGIPSLLANRALGLLELSLGRPAEAHRYLGPLTESIRTSGIVEPGAMRFVADEIETLIMLGRSREAERLLAELEDRAERLDRPSARVAAARSRGLLLSDAGSHDEAVAVLKRALEQRDSVAMPFERARTLLVLGRVARRSKARRLAGEALADAERIFTELGASIWSAAARDELRRIPGRKLSHGGLTPTEARVAELLSDGRSTAEVAAAMFVTPKTVETYASRIYAKLDVHSRAGLIAKIAGRSTAKL